MMNFEELVQKGFIPATLHRIATNNRTVPHSNAIKLASSKLDVVGVTCDKPKWVAITTNSVEDADEVYSANEEFVYVYRKDGHEFFKLSVADQGLVALEISSVGESVSTDTSKNNSGAREPKEDYFMANLFNNMGAIPTGENAGAGVMGAFTDPAGAKPAGAAPTGIQQKTNGRVNREFKVHCANLSKVNHFITGTEAIVSPKKTQYPVLGPDQKPLIKPGCEAEAKQAIDAGKKPARKLLQLNTTIGFAERKPGAIKAVCFTRPAILESDPKILNAIVANEKVDFDSSNKDTVVKIDSIDAFNTYVGLCCYEAKIKENEYIYGPDARVFRLSIVDYTKKVKGKEDEKRRKSKLSVCKPADKNQKVNTSVLLESNYVPMKIYGKTGQQNLTAEQIEQLNNTLVTVIKDQATYELLDEAAKAVIKWDASNETNPVTSEYFKEGKCQAISVKRFFDKEKDLADVKLPLKQRGTKKDGGTTYKFVTFNFDDETHGIKADNKYKGIIAKSGYSDLDAYITDVKQATKKTSKSEGSARAGITGEGIYDLLLANETIDGFMAATKLQDLMNPVFG